MLTKNKFNREIDRVVRQLIELYKPEKIILFGLLASGKINEGTDIDLFIIKKDVPEFGADRIRQLDKLIKYKLATDFVVYKPVEVKERLKSGDPFVKNIFTEGKVLYDAA